jgi:hypothetical protein
MGGERLTYVWVVVPQLGGSGKEAGMSDMSLMFRRPGVRLRRGAVLAVAGLLLGGALSGCSGSGSASASAPGSDSRPSGKSSASASSSPAGPGSGSASPSGSPSSPAASTSSLRHGLAALRTAERAVAHSAAFALEHDDGVRHEWEVKLAARGGKRWEVRVANDGGKVVGKHLAGAREDSDGDGGRDDDAAGVRGAQISAREALRLVAERHAGSELDSLESDRDARGRLVWQVVTVGPGTRSGPDASGTETLLDAKSGKVLGERSES